MNDNEATLAAELVARIVVCPTKCWACYLGQCPGAWHTWADADDIEHAARTGRPDPSASRCGCPCSEGPDLGPGFEEPDMDAESYTSTPCPECGEVGACAYDDQGRALIHALDDDDERRIDPGCES